MESVSGNCCSLIMTLIGSSPSATDVPIIAAECGGTKFGSVNLEMFGGGAWWEVVHSPVCETGGKNTC